MTPAKPITILIAEDHAVVRQGLCALLKLDGRFEIAGEARTGREAVALARQFRPDIILMDIAMPVLNGLDATRQIRAANPEAKVVILSAHTDDVYVERMIQTGVAGFLEKQTSSEILAKALCLIAAGRPYFSPTVAARLRAAQDRAKGRNGRVKANSRHLTARECEVLQLVAEGAANKQVASELGISIKTVEKHRQHLMRKLGIHDTATLTRYAIAAGIVENSVQLTITS